MSAAIAALLAVYRQIWIVDTEYQARPGARLRPICLCAIELRSGVRIRLWLWDCESGPPPWDPDDPSVLVVCFSAVAECGFFLACGWRTPRNILDLWLAYRLLTNGVVPIHRTKLLAVLDAFGIPHAVDDEEKGQWRQLCIDGGPALIEAAVGILNYCMGDVDPLVLLLEVLLPLIDLAQVLALGAYSALIAETEHRGIPIDVERLRILQDRWEYVRAAAAAHANASMRFRVFGGLTPTSFSYERVEEYFRRVDLFRPFPRTECGRLRLDKHTLKAWASRHEDLVHLRQARQILSMLHPTRIHAGPDGRCRTPLLPFCSITSRNQPKAHWPLAFLAPMRALVRPPEGGDEALVVLDFSQEDPGVGAALSEDGEMIRAYRSPRGSPDFYMSFAVRAWRAAVERQRQ